MGGGGALICLKTTLRFVGNDATFLKNDLTFFWEDRWLSLIFLIFFHYDIAKKKGQVRIWLVLLSLSPQKPENSS